jgi:hypothetical protein
MKRALRNAVVAAAFLALASPLTAQESRGTIFGRVTDPQGAAVPAVDVLIVNVDTNAVKKAVSNESGYYEMPLLDPGKAIADQDRGKSEAHSLDFRQLWHGLPQCKNHSVAPQQ